jgi:hypothetical protein
VKVLNWIRLVKSMGRWWAVMKTVMNLGLHKNGGIT